MKVNAYLNFAGRTEEAFNFYRSVFGGEFSSLERFSDMPMPGSEMPAGEQAKIMHIALPIGDGNTLMGSDVPESLGQTVVPGNHIKISVHPDSRAEADRIFAGLSAGGTIEQPIGDAPWGDYYGSLEDKFGVPWMVNYHPDESAPGSAA